MAPKLYHLTGPDGQEYETTERGTVYGCMQQPSNTPTML